MEKLRYFVSEAVHNLWKNRVMSLASFGVLAVCLLLLGSSVLVSFNIQKLVSDIEGQNQVMVFLNDNLTADQITDLGSQIKALGNVRACVFVSKEEAFEQQKKELGKDADLLNGYDVQSFLPNAYRVSFKSMEQYGATVGVISKMQGVYKVQQHTDVANRLLQIDRAISRAGAVLFVLLVLVALFIISNTIKLALYVRKREINIMKFVGATDWFIRWPFIIEGILIGLISGLIAFGLQVYLYAYPFAHAARNIGLGVVTVTSGGTALLCLGFLVVGIVVGAVGSLISMGKYLKV